MPFSIFNLCITYEVKAIILQLWLQAQLLADRKAFSLQSGSLPEQFRTWQGNQHKPPYSR